MIFDLFISSISVLESKAQMQAETVEGDGRAEEDVEISVAPDPDAWLPAA